ncbi:hypothetical protein DPX16_23787 [Anabarilius grahami]|uniref:Uncharacterized protein n=1 Tax=Anabarilius grahami TaxID=495550 RepID=A0A3N0Z5E3_ANAGA|nr:hypothetical protein DPX16_23787 [Anabarilius grahami]
MTEQSRRCVPPCSRTIAETDTHPYCFVCLGEEHAVLALEGGECEHCELFTVKMLRARLSFFQGSAPALRSWGSQMDLADERETGPALSPDLSPDPRVSSRDPEAHSGASSAHAGDDDSLLEFAASERSSRDDKAVEELLEVVTRAVARLKLDWPQEKETPKPSKLEDRVIREMSPCVRVMIRERNPERESNVTDRNQEQRREDQHEEHTTRGTYNTRNIQHEEHTTRGTTGQTPPRQQQSVAQIRSTSDTRGLHADQMWAGSWPTLYAVRAGLQTTI